MAVITEYLATSYDDNLLPLLFVTVTGVSDSQNQQKLACRGAV